MTANGHEGSLQGDGNVLKLVCGGGCTTLNLLKVVICTLLINEFYQ